MSFVTKKDGHRCLVTLDVEDDDIIVIDDDSPEIARPRTIGQHVGTKRPAEVKYPGTPQAYSTIHRTDKQGNDNNGLFCKPVDTWRRQYAPKTVSECHVSPKRLSELQQWLAQVCKQLDTSAHPPRTPSTLTGTRLPLSTLCPLLVCVGPSGSGKTAAVRVVCNDAHRNISEWVDSSQLSFQHHTSRTTLKQATHSLSSALERFDCFMRRAIRFVGLGAGSDKVIVIDEMPFMYEDREKERFFQLLGEYASHTRFPIIWTVNESSLRQDRTMDQLFRQCLPARARVLKFPAVGVRLLRKAVNRLIDMAQNDYQVDLRPVLDQPVPSDKPDARTKSTVLSTSVSNCQGDLGGLVNTLEWMCKPFLSTQSRSTHGSHSHRKRRKLRDIRHNLHSVLVGAAASGTTGNSELKHATAGDKQRKLDRKFTSIVRRRRGKTHEAKTASVVIEKLASDTTHNSTRNSQKPPKDQHTLATMLSGKDDVYSLFRVMFRVLVGKAGKPIAQLLQHAGMSPSYFLDMFHGNATPYLVRMLDTITRKQQQEQTQANPPQTSSDPWDLIDSALAHSSGHASREMDALARLTETQSYADVLTTQARSLGYGDSMHGGPRDSVGCVLSVGVYRQVRAELARSMPAVSVNYTLAGMTRHRFDGAERAVDGVIPRSAGSFLREQSLMQQQREEEQRTLLENDPIE